MKELQQRIKHLESTLNKNNRRIVDDSYLLRESLNSKLLVLLEIGGGFMAGFLLMRSKRKMGFIKTLISLALVARKAKKNLHLLSFLLKNQ